MLRPCPNARTNASCSAPGYPEILAWCRPYQSSKSSVDGTGIFAYTNTFTIIGIPCFYPYKGCRLCHRECLWQPALKVETTCADCPFESAYCICPLPAQAIHLRKDFAHIGFSTYVFIVCYAKYCRRCMPMIRCCDHQCIKIFFL